MGDVLRCWRCAAADTKFDTISVRGCPRFVCNDERACREEQARLFQLDLQVVPGDELWNLRADRDALAAVIEQVRALHRQVAGTCDHCCTPCDGCCRHDWPCPTAALLPEVSP